MLRVNETMHQIKYQIQSITFYSPEIRRALPHKSGKSGVFLLFINVFSKITIIFTDISVEFLPVYSGLSSPIKFF